MQDYEGLKDITDPVVRQRTVAGLKRLRQALAEQIPQRSATDTLLLATWNIREFDSGQKCGYRSSEAYYYIAEILSRFDLIAVQEVKDGLYPMQHVRKLLGSWWDYLVTDVTLGSSGNTERMAYLYDQRKVSFTGLAAELVLPKASGEKTEPVQMARSPYVAGFRAGWAWLTLATVHIYYGKSVAVDERRLAEITAFGKTLARHADTLSSAPQLSPGAKPERDNLIVLGDFNIFNRRDVTLEAIIAAGFRVPEALQQIPGSNVKQDKHYDQIAYFKTLNGLRPTGKAGVFDFYVSVFTLEQEADYESERLEKPGRSYQDWRTFRMSDHLPMWIEFNIEDGDAFLEEME